MKGSKTAVAGATLASALTLGAAATYAQRPNIIYIMSDDHAYQAVSAYRAHMPGLLNLNSTPNLDRIADEGAIFLNAFCENSICGPSRAAHLTGRYSFNNSYMENYREIDTSQSMFPQLLRAAGYQTVMIGKWHLEEHSGVSKTRNQLVTKCGYDVDRTHTGQGPYNNPTLGGTAYTGYTPDVVTTVAIDWMRTQRDTARPFYISLHHKAVHRTWDPDAAHLHMYDAVTFPYPSTFDDDDNGFPTRTAAADEATMQIDPNMNAADFGGTMPSGKNAKYQAYLRRYLAVVASVNDNVGRILNYLDTSGLAANTVVIYTSDQGFYLGEHGWFDKRWLYEQSLREPLMIRWPGRITPGRVVSAFVQNIDFGPTFLDMAGVAVPADMDGKSIVPLFSGSTPPTWRQSVFNHYYEWPTDHAVRQHYGIRGSRYKLIYFYTRDEWELYDLQSDPSEINNVAATPSYAAVLDTMKRNLIALRIQSREGQPVDVPARIQAEKYYNMRSSTMRTTCFTSIIAGVYMSGLQAGNWLEYLIDVPVNGRYRCYYRVAANQANGRIAYQAEKINTFGVDALLAEPSYTAMDTTVITNNGSLTTFHTDSTGFLTLQQGVYHVRLYFLSAGYNIDWVQWGLIQATQVSSMVTKGDLDRFSVWMSGNDIFMRIPEHSFFGKLPARFALFTMDGRQVWEHSATVSGSGPRTVRLGSAGGGVRQVPSGIYVLRVSLSGSSRTLVCSVFE